MIGSSIASRARDLLRMTQNYKQVQLLGVSKGMPADTIRQASSLGIRSFGENYVQEWKLKAEELKDQVIDWHFIGHLQTNKAKEVVGKVSLIHSVDRISLAETINKLSLSNQSQQDILIEVNLAGEESKSGASIKDVPALLESMSNLAGLRIRGMMVMPPFSEDSELSRPYFLQARRSFEDWRKLVNEDHWTVLSMGTSQDFHVALEEGSNLIRVGTALFGPRM